MNTDIEILMLKIHIVYHEKLPTTNVFLTNQNDIKKTIRELAEKSETNIDEWNVREIIKGVPFIADMHVT